MINEVVFIIDSRLPFFRTCTVFIYWIKSLLKKLFLFKKTKQLFNNVPFPELLKCQPTFQRFSGNMLLFLMKLQPDFTYSNFKAFFTALMKSEVVYCKTRMEYVFICYSVDIRRTTF